MRNVLCLTAAGVLLSLAAFADPPANTVMKATPPAPPAAQKGPPDMAQMCQMKDKMQLASLEMLGASLKLTDAQKPLFQDWRKARLKLWDAAPCPPPPTGLGTPVPDRIHNQITMVSATLDGLRLEYPAAKAFYAVLTPEQRAILDGPMKMAMPPAAPPPPPANAAKPPAPPPAH